MDVVEQLDILIRADYHGLKADIDNATKTLNQSFEKALKDVQTGKIDINKLFNKNFYSSINWTSIISKLFSPANLLAFFSAMAATGIVAAAAEQGAFSGGAQGGTPAGLGLTPTQRTDVTDAARTIANQTGVSTASIITAIEALLPALGDNVQAAENLAASLAMSPGITSENIAATAGQFGGTLQTLGI